MRGNIGFDEMMVDQAVEPQAQTRAPATVSRRSTSTGIGRTRSLAVECPPACRTNLIGDMICKDGLKSKRNSCTREQHPAQACQTPGVVMSVWGSGTTDMDHFAPYFSQKHINFDGELRTMNHRIGVMSHRGKKPEYPNQDDFFVLAREESLLFGVLDGHGPNGHDIAHFAQEMLPGCIVERLRQGSLSWDQIVHASFGELTRHLREDLSEKAETSGSTVSIALLDRENGVGPLRLRGAFLGDSIVAHARRSSKDEPWEVKLLIDTHRPDREDECARIEAAGGDVLYPEVEGDPARLVTPEWRLAMSRSAGDFHAEPFGLSSQPELMTEIQFDDEGEHLILCCSDGIWDVLPPSQAVDFVARFPPEDAQLAVERLVTKAQRRWQEQGDVVDDITAILIWPAAGSLADLESDAA